MSGGPFQFQQHLFVTHPSRAAKGRFVNNVGSRLVVQAAERTSDFKSGPRRWPSIISDEMVTRLFYMGGTLALVVLTGQRQTTQADYRVTGQIRDVCGRVLPGALVTLANKSGVTLNRTSDVEGRYAFLQLPEPGPWTLTAKEVGFLPAVIDDVVLSSPTSTVSNIRLLTDPSTVRTSTIYVSDGPAGAAPLFPHELVGTVTRSGAPAAGAIVTLSKASNGPVQQCVCDEFGRYQFMVTDRGPWTLQVELSGFEKYRRPEVYLVHQQRVTMDITLSPVPQGR